MRLRLEAPKPRTAKMSTTLLLMPMAEQTTRTLAYRGLRFADGIA